MRILNTAIISLLSLGLFTIFGFKGKENRIPKRTSANEEKYIAKYVWSIGFAFACDMGPRTFQERTLQTYLDPAKIRAGDTVWVQAPLVVDFANLFLPQFDKPFILVITDEDNPFPSSHAKKIDIEALIQHPMIIHIYAQNCDYSGPSQSKVSHLPIGVDFHTVAHSPHNFLEKSSISYQRQEELLELLLSTLAPTRDRKHRAFVDFQLHDTIRSGGRHTKLGEDRHSIYEKIEKSGVIDTLRERVPRNKLWERKGQYAFSIAPQGNGMDTHRLWEDLILGCIVITKTSPLDPLYAGLPVVIVQDWSEVTAENFEKWLAQYGDAFERPEYREKLTLAYWLNLMDEQRRSVD